MVIPSSSVFVERRRYRRRGLTLVEMLFAIAILLVGMVGIASVLGAAGRNAVRSRTLAEAQAVANNAFDTFLAYEMNRRSKWRPLIPTYHGACVDPLGLAANSHHFFGNIANHMRRVSISGPSGNEISAKVAEKVFMSSDDLALERDGDSSLSITRKFVLGKSENQALYSWFATITLANVVANNAVVSIVTVKNRDLSAADVDLIVTPVLNAPPESGGALRAVINNFPSSQGPLRTGDWIMLSSRQSGSIPFDSWYRVINVSGNDPGVPTVQLNVTLSGRQLPANASTVIGTYVPGVVNVHERVVTLLP